MAVLPISDMIVVPDSTIVFRKDIYKKLAGKEAVQDEKVTLILLKDDEGQNQLRNDNVYPIGVAGFVRDAGSQGFVQLNMTHRVRLDYIDFLPDGRVILDTSKVLDVDDLDIVNSRSRFLRIREEILAMSKKYQWGAMMDTYVMSWHNIGDIICAVSPWMDIPSEKRYELLTEDRKSVRFDMMESMLYEYIEMMKVKINAQTDTQEAYQKAYKEQALKKQIEYMQKELDKMHPEEMSGLRKLEIKLEEAGMNEEAKKEADKLLKRLKSEGQNSAETGMITDYLEFLASLPWKKEEFQDIDLADAKKILNDDHYGLDKVKKRILEQIAVMQLKKQQSGSIILFVGAPGTGKTSIGQSIAKALKREYVRVSLGGVRDEADIRGHRRTYIGSMPGRIMDGIQKSGVSNPVMVLDEVDKLSMSYNGDPASALLEVLDPEQNATFTDHYMNVPYDLSDVLFICTANTLDTIPEPLLNRMEVIQFPGYTPIEKQQIAVRHLLPKAKKSAGLEDEDLIMSEDVIAKVIEDYTREAGVRGLKKRMDTISRSVAVKLVMGDEAPITVTESNLQDYLDMNPIHQKKVKDTVAPGVVTGLAWTPIGGTILYIESSKMKGNGKLTITGQLGDVMKESAQIAMSLVRNLFADQVDNLDKTDIHIHVPDGATPKDGPSAGITLTTALSSLFTGIPVSPHVAMTGEVSLQGGVNPIGGLPEKLMAAQRSGVTKVFIPKDNVDDLRDVAQEVKDQLEIIPVETVKEVLTNLEMYHN